MSENEDLTLSEDIQKEIEAQAQSANIEDSHKCTDDERIECATKYGVQAVENQILISISQNINIMASAIKESEKQKHTEREKCICFFRELLVFLVGIATLLIIADTFWDISVRIEFLVSVILAILADVFAIVHTLIKYMTNVENYDAYSKLIDSLLKHIDYRSKK